jgi:hypothetical protein
VKNLVLVPEMATARARGLKDVTRRLNTNVKPGDVVYHGETLVQKTMSIPGNPRARVASYKDGTPCMICDSKAVWLWEWKVSTLSSRYCPERCARLFSMIRSVREERLQDITEEDAKREGVKAPVFPCETNCSCGQGPRPNKVHPAFSVLAPFEGRRDGTTVYRVQFSMLWDELHPKAPWSSNPRLYRIDLGPNLTRDEAVRLAGIRNVGERLEAGKVAA